MYWRDVYQLYSYSQALLADGSNTANNWISGITSDYHSYNPSNSRYASVAATRSSVINSQRGISSIKGTNRYSTRDHWLANSSSASANANRISYLVPAGSRPSAYYWGQEYSYKDPTKVAFVNQGTDGLNFYRFSDGNKVILDQVKNDARNYLFYNHFNLDNNLLTLSNTGAVSKIESATDSQDNTTNSSTPFLFQTHGGIGANNGGAMVTDYAKDSHMQADDRDTYVIYRPNFGSNVQLPSDIETMGEWYSNYAGGRSGS